jgi:hypothetical protein
MADTFSVKLHNEDRSFNVTVEEFHPYEPSAYVTDPGWTCFDGAGAEFYVSQGTGDVYEQPANECIGTVLALKEEADRIEAEISKAMGDE